MGEYEKIQIDNLQDLIHKVRGLARLQSLYPIVVDYSTYKRILEVSNNYEAFFLTLKLTEGWLEKCIESIEGDKEDLKDGRREGVEDIEVKEKSNVYDAIIKQYPDTHYPLSKAFIEKECSETRKETGFIYFSDLNNVQKVDWLREQTKKIKLAFLQMPPLKGRLAKICVENVYSSLTEAGMYLGFQLEEFAIDET